MISARRVGAGKTFTICDERKPEKVWNVLAAGGHLFAVWLKAES
jgi:hypothetical protein